MEQKGEFEQKPEIKPAEQVPLPKAKSSPLPWILCAIFALTTIGLGIFIAVNGVGGKTNSNAGSTSSEEKKGNKNTEYPDCSDTDGDEKDCGAGNGEQSNAQGYMYYADFGTFYVTNKGDVYLSMKEGGIKAPEVGGSWDYYVNFEKGHEPGVYGEYTITEKDGITIMSDNLTIKGYKLDFKAPNAIKQLNMGNNWLGWNIAFSYEDGHVDWLFIAPDGFTAQNHTAWAKITKNVGGYTDVASVEQDSDDSGWGIAIIRKSGKRELMEPEAQYALEDITK